MIKFIEQYINKITLNDIVNFADKNNISIDKYTSQIIYFYIKNYWYDLLYKDSNSILNKLKKEINLDIYNKIEKLFYFYKNKYKDYL